jgi:hypothetical protein
MKVKVMLSAGLAAVLVSWPGGEEATSRVAGRFTPSVLYFAGAFPIGPRTAWRFSGKFGPGRPSRNAAP